MKQDTVCTMRIFGTIPKLQAQLMEALPELEPDDFAYHATDLYVVALPQVREWLKRNYEFWPNVQMFQSQAGSRWNGAGRMCFDIPFAGYWPERAQ